MNLLFRIIERLFQPLMGFNKTDGRQNKLIVHKRENAMVTVQRLHRTPLLVEITLTF